MPNATDLENAIKAHEFALEQARTFGDELLQALNMVDLVSDQDSKDLFKRKAERALVAYENWQKSVSLAAKVLQEIYSKL